MGIKISRKPETENTPMARKRFYICFENLKFNKTRDPLGMINEIFKPGVIGQDLFSALVVLINEVKSENYMPHFMRLANITSILKKKKS